jgi:hypothetical protein
MNGASEATLQELLAVAKATNINLANFIKAAGGTAASGGTGGVAASAASTASSFNLAGMAAKTVGGAFSLLGTIVGGVVGTASDLAGNFYDFSKAAMNGTASLGQLALVFKDLPIVGRFAPIIAEIFDYADKLSGFYRNMTKTGASFGGDLFAMSTAAAKSGLTLQSFTAIVSQNSEQFATMGLNVQNGIDKFTQASGALLGPGSKFSKTIFGLGYTADDAGNALATVIGQQGTMGAKNALTADQLAQKTKEYLVELDALAKLTGVSREEQEKLQKEANKDQAFQLFKSRLDGAGKATLNTLENTAKGFGPGFMDAIKYGSSGIIAPFTKAGEDLNQASRGMYGEIAKTARDLVKAGVPAEEAKRIILEKFGKASMSIDNFTSNMNDQQLQVNAGMINNVSAASRFAQALKDSGGDVNAAMAKIKKQQDEQATGNASAIGQANQSIQNFGAGLTSMMNKVLGPVTTKLAGWTETFMNGASDLVKPNGPLDGVLTDFMKQFESVGGWLTKTFEFLQDKKEPGTFWEKLEIKAKEAWNNIKTSFTKFMDSDMGKELKGFWNDTVKPMFNEVLESIKSSLGTTFLGMMEWLIAQMRKNSTIAKFLFGETSIEKIEKNDTEIKRLKDQIRGFGEALDGMSERQINSARGKSVLQQNQTAVNRLAELERETALLRGDPVVPQPKAKGGPINAGTYLVGEKGPEILNVGASGNVVSNDSIAALLARTGESDKAITGLINMLNTQNKQMLSYIAEMTDYTKRNNDALKSMSGDAFA